MIQVILRQGDLRQFGEGRIFDSVELPVKYGDFSFVRLARRFIIEQFLHEWRERRIEWILLLRNQRRGRQDESEKEKSQERPRLEHLDSSCREWKKMNKCSSEAKVDHQSCGPATTCLQS